MRTVEEIDKEIAELNYQRLLLAYERRNALMTESGFKAGDIVRLRGVEHVLTEFRTNCWIGNQIIEGVMAERGYYITKIDWCVKVGEYPREKLVKYYEERGIDE